MRGIKNQYPIHMFQASKASTKKSSNVWSMYQPRRYPGHVEQLDQVDILDFFSDKGNSNDTSREP